MDYQKAIFAVRRVRDQGIRHSVKFVTPIASTLLASLATTSHREKVCNCLNFVATCIGYAENNGLVDAISGRYSFPMRSGRQGSTYTKLTKLATHQEVDLCNEIVNDLLYSQLQGFDVRVIHELAKVVGELHDNVASHAGGTGFSCAQVYDQQGAKRIQFAIADSGRGMRSNVQRLHPDMGTHTEAVQWCLARGHTTVRKIEDPWAQRLPDDAIINPFPTARRASDLENHHVGEGLWKLAELVRGLQGELWVLSGDGQFTLKNGQERTESCRVEWHGVAIEFELVVSHDSRPTPEQQAGIEALAGRIGL